MMRKTVFLQTPTLMHSLAFVLSGIDAAKKSVAGDDLMKGISSQTISKGNTYSNEAILATPNFSLELFKKKALSVNSVEILTL